MKWIERNLGYRWSEGHIDYHEFRRIIKPYLEHKQVFVKGLEKTRWIKELCANCVVRDVEDVGCPNLLVLSKKYNPISCVNHFMINKNCALKNVLCIRNWCLDNLTKLN